MARRKTLFIILHISLVCALFVLASSPVTWNANAQSSTAAPTQAATSSTSSESRIMYVDVVYAAKATPTPASVMTLLDPVTKDTHYLPAPAGMMLTYAVPSPDQQWLALVGTDLKSSDQSHESLYVMKMDGSSLQQLTQKADLLGTSNAILQPVWSADSKQLLYFVSTFKVSGRQFQGLGGVIRIATIDGSNPAQQTEIHPDTTAKFSNLLWPAWSPDGKTILFSPRSETDPSVNVLWKMDVDGKHAMHFKEPGRLPAWSPDGKHLALLSPSGSIEITDADGSNPRKVITLNSQALAALTWSPDGTQLAYLLFKQGKQGKSPLYVINIDGSKPTVVQELKGYSLYLDWALVSSEMVSALPQGTPTIAPSSTTKP